MTNDCCYLKCQPTNGWGRSFEDGVKWKVGDGKDISF